MMRRLLLLLLLLPTVAGAQPRQGPAFGTAQARWQACNITTDGYNGVCGLPTASLPTCGASSAVRGHYYDTTTNTLKFCNGTSWQTVATSAGSGDVVGPASATDNALARFDTTTGKLLQNGVVLVGDTGAVTGVLTLVASGAISGETFNIEDSNASHYLVLKTTSDLTANRDLTVVTGDAARTVTIFGDTTLPVFGQSITFTGPTAARSIALPDEAFTVAGVATTQTLTGKTLAAADNVIGADTAVALAADPANCTAGNYPLGVDASGAVESCTAAGDMLLGTAQTITAAKTIDINADAIPLKIVAHSTQTNPLIQAFSNNGTDSAWQVTHNNSYLTTVTIGGLAGLTRTQVTNHSSGAMSDTLSWDMTADLCFSWADSGGGMFSACGDGPRSAVLALTAGTMTSEKAAALRDVIHSYTWTNAQVVALGAVTSGEITVATLPAKTEVRRAKVIITGAGAGTTTLTVSCGVTGAAYIDYVVASDAKAAANTVYGDATAEVGTGIDGAGEGLASYTGTTAVKCQFVSTGANLDQVTGSTGRVILETALLQ